MQLHLPKQIEYCLQQLNENYEAVLVGGAIRDALLNKEAHDFDIATSATPTQVKEVFSNHVIFDTGIQHGTVTVVVDLQPIEITTYRIESDYIDGRRPNHISFTTSLKEDCARRDFTINALCYRPDGEIVDYFCGVEDLHNHIIRCINNPIDRFNEDALRIMRAIRFSAQLGFNIEEQTKTALFELKDHLKKISIERFTSEFNRILISDHFDKILNEYIDVFAVVIPELKQLSEKPHWQETLNRLKNSPNKVTFRLAILFMNLSTLTSSENSSLQSASQFVLLAKRLKFSNEVSGTAARYIQNVNVELVDDRISIKKRMHQFSDSFLDYLQFRHAYDLDETQYKRISRTVADIISKQEPTSLNQLAINGNDLIELGITGSKISLTLKRALMWVIEEKIPNNRYKILDMIKADLRK